MTAWPNGFPKRNPVGIRCPPVSDPIYEQHRYAGVIGITNPAPVAGYQHYLTLPYLPGMRPDFSDVRFAQIDGTPVPYWRESCTAGSTAGIWFKPASINQSFVRLLYGNPTCGDGSNGDRTFELFDDFLGTTLDTSKWTLAGSMGSSMSNSVLGLTGVNNANGRIYTSCKFGTDYVWRSRSLWGGNGGSSFFGFLDWDTINNGASIWDTAGYSGNVINAGTITSSGTSVDANWHIYEIARNGSSSVIFRRDGTTYWSTTNCPSVSMPLICRQYAQGYGQQHDWILVRKHTATEPTCTLLTQGERNPYRRR